MGEKGAVKAHTNWLVAAAPLLFFLEWNVAASVDPCVCPPRAWRPLRATTAAARAAARAEPRRERGRESGEKKVMEKLHLWSCVRIGERTGQKNLSFQPQLTDTSSRAEIMWVRGPEPFSVNCAVTVRPNSTLSHGGFLSLFLRPFLRKGANEFEREWSAPTEEAEMIQWKDQTRFFVSLLQLLLLRFLGHEWGIFALFKLFLSFYFNFYFLLSFELSEEENITARLDAFPSWHLGVTFTEIVDS